MIPDSKLAFDVSSALSRKEGLSFVSMAVEEETEIRSDLRRFAESFKKGFVFDKGFRRIFYFIIDWGKNNCSQIVIDKSYASSHAVGVTLLEGQRPAPQGRRPLLERSAPSGLV
jgi:hypothetical protein